MQEPDISVVLGVFNEEPYIEDAVGSVCSQVGMSLQVIVVDDFSTDRTWDILERLVLKFKNLSIFRNGNKGKCFAFNLGVAKATGRFVCLFGGDDIMPAGSLLSRFNMVKHLSDTVPVVGLSKLETMSARKSANGIIVPRAPGVGSTSGCSPLMNRKALSKIFPVPTQFPNEDGWMEIAIDHFPGWTIVQSDIVGTRWRIHEGNSMSEQLPFAEFSQRYAQRKAAYQLFLDVHGGELNENRQKLQALADCEKARLTGNPVTIMMTSTSLKSRLRALFYSNKLFYAIISRFYGLFIGR